jgi:E3 ubiquitin-protein ligase UBR7
MENTNLNNIENTEQETYSFQDVLKNVNQEIVFVSKMDQKKDLKTCTYNQGYISQELWACMTCYKNKAELAAICIGCSFTCHKDHELVHLYFKRNFRCDCGNKRFGKKKFILFYENFLLC